MSVQPNGTNLTVVLTLTPYFKEAHIIQTFFESMYLSIQPRNFSTPDAEMRKTTLGANIN